MFKLYDFGPFRLDPTCRKVWRGEDEIDLTGKQFDVLQAIVRREGAVAERGKIFEEVWPGDQSDLGLRLARHVTDLREKLRGGNGDPNYLENVSGQGYYINVPVKIIFPEQETPPRPGAFFSRPQLLAIAAAILLTIVLIIVGLVTYTHSRREAPTVTGSRALTNDGRAKQGPLLSDGHRLIFVERIGDEWKAVSVPFSGGDVSSLDMPLHIVELCDVSADGSELLFSTPNGHGTKLMSWPLNGGSPRMIVEDVSNAGWAPDRKTVAFGAGSSLVVANSGGRTASYAPQFTGVKNPRWSPDGTRIRFTLFEPKNRRASIWQADSRGGNLGKVRETAGLGDNQSYGTWTVDGRRFFFEAGSDQKRDLWMIEDSRKPVRLTDGPFNWTWPVPAKSGERVFSLGESRRGELDRLDPSTGVWSPYLGGIAAFELDFSRDGDWIAYTRYPDHTIWKAHTDGSEPTQLTPPDIEAHQPHWSPDGRRIAFMGHKAGEPWRVFMVDLATRSIVQPIRDGDDQGVPTWSRDGHMLVFGDRLLVKDHSEMKIHLFDERSGQLSVLPGSSNLWTARWSLDGAYVSALRPDGTALLVSRCCFGEWKTIFEGVALDDSMWSSDSKSIFLMEANAPGRRWLIRVQIADGRVERLADVTGFPATGEQWFGLTQDGSVLGLKAAFSQEIYALDYKVR